MRAPQIHPSDSKITDPHFVVIIEAVINGRSIKSTGGATHKHQAFLRALGELGENVILYNSDLNSRCGIAAGWLSSMAIVRSKGELIERDAFFYHYRNLVPYTRRQKLDGDAIAFEMQAADPRFSAILVTNEASANLASECLQFGAAAHPDRKVALAKALQEYHIMRYTHQRHPGRCAERAQNQKLITDILDLHHVHSRDLRNRTRFHQLCRVRENSPRENLNSSGWVIETLESPIRGLHYVRCEHGDLIKLTFGVPEPFANSSEDELLHPFW